MSPCIHTLMENAHNHDPTSIFSFEKQNMQADKRLAVSAANIDWTTAS
jgi:hypothetical protein